MGADRVDLAALAMEAGQDGRERGIKREGECVETIVCHWCKGC